MNKGFGVVRLVLLTGLLAVFLVFLFAIASAYNERRQAERFLLVLEQVRVGSTDRANVVRITGPFLDHMDASTQDQLGFVFYNKWLSRLKLASHAEFRGWISFKDGLTVQKSARELVSSSGCVATVQERIRGYGILTGVPLPPNHQVAWSDVPPQQYRRIRIENDTTYADDERRKDWQFNLGCLTRIGRGCSDARTMLPNAVLTPPEQANLTKCRFKRIPNR